MSSAPAPAPHVPVSFLLAGGSAVFSADCVKAFIACHINPNWVGTYGSISQRQEAARRVVDQHNAHRRAGLPSPREPTFEERWLANSTSGHLARDAPHRRGPGSGPRGSSVEREPNNCATIVDGYTYRGAAAMVSLGSRDTPGTVEADISAREDRQITDRRAASPGSDAYPADQRRADQNACIGTAVQSQQRNFPEGLNRTSDRGPNHFEAAGARRVEEDRRAAVNRAGRNPTAALGNTAAAPVPAARAGEATVPVIDNKNKKGTASEQAQECLEAYRDALETDEAKREALRAEEARQVARTQDPAAMEALGNEQAAASARVATAQREHAAAAAAQQQLEQQAAALRGVNYPGRNRRLAQVDQEARNAAQTTAARAQDVQTARDAEQRINQMAPGAQIRCIQQQRARIDAGPAAARPEDRPRTVGRLPDSNEQ